FVGKWRSRFHRLRVGGIQKDAPRPGRVPTVPQETVDRIVHATLHEKPRGATHWSTRSMAGRVDVSHMTVQRVWKLYNLQPHRTRSFKLSRDKKFVEKLVDVVGLYMNPPEKAVVLSIDEKPQIQALERAQTILPVRPGVPEGRSHDYRRNGKIDLFAALNTLDGTVITEFHHRHRNQEFLHFLRTVDARVAPELDVHMIMDNLSVHKHDNVERWLVRHPRFRFHFVPTGSSWLNAVENWFGRLTDKQIRRGSFASVPQLKKAIKEYVAAYMANPRPFVWTKSVDEILSKIQQTRIMTKASVTPH
ncbi:MAG: IS630 family transposase, partial [bacterium]